MDLLICKSLSLLHLLFFENFLHEKLEFLPIDHQFPIQGFADLELLPVEAVFLLLDFRPLCLTLLAQQTAFFDDMRPFQRCIAFHRVPTFGYVQRYVDVLAQLTPLVLGRAHQLNRCLEVFAISVSLQVDQSQDQLCIVVLALGHGVRDEATDVLLGVLAGVLIRHERQVDKIGTSIHKLFVVLVGAEP